MFSRGSALLLIFSAALLVFISSCSRSKTSAATFPVGQKVQVGKIFYQVLEAQWLPEVPGGKKPPKNRILQLHITITNGGGEAVSVPFLRMVDAAGNETVEVSDIEGNSRWLGVLRRLQPALTEEGTIYFDVPIGAYRLELVDYTSPEEEKTAFVEIPASLAPPPRVPSPTGQ